MYNFLFETKCIKSIIENGTEIFTKGEIYHCVSVRAGYFLMTNNSFNPDSVPHVSPIVCTDFQNIFRIDEKARFL